MIRLQDIQVTFNAGTILENKALKGVSLDVPEHQFLTVIGSNGRVSLHYWVLSLVKHLWRVDELSSMRQT